MSQVPLDFLEWVWGRRAQNGRKVFVLVLDNAVWHISQKVRDWMRAHNARVKRAGGVRILNCLLPTKSPWRHRLEPHWGQGKRAIVEPARTVSAAEWINRVCTYFHCDHVAHLKQKVS